MFCLRYNVSLLLIVHYVLWCICLLSSVSLFPCCLAGCTLMFPGVSNIVELCCGFSCRLFEFVHVWCNCTNCRLLMQMKPACRRIVCYLNDFDESVISSCYQVTWRNWGLYCRAACQECSELSQISCVRWLNLELCFIWFLFVVCLILARSSRQAFVLECLLAAVLEYALQVDW
jgi:hypothetical protein